MPLNADNVVLHAKTSSQAAMVTGMILTLGSVGVGVGGGVPFYVAGSVSQPSTPGDHSNQVLKDVGFGFMALGAAMLVVGIPLWIINGSSSVSSDAGGPLARGLSRGIAF